MVTAQKMKKSILGNFVLCAVVESLGSSPIYVQRYKLSKAKYLNYT